jgi:hypothetical protein
MRTYLLTICCFACFLSKAQDTIFVASKEPLLVRVLEISDKEVKYKNFFNPDGVIRFINNTEVLKIVYENGQEEARFKNKATAAIFGSADDVKLEKFVIDGKRLVYKNEDISHNAAFKIMMLRDFKKNSDELNDALVTVQQKKTGQVTFTVLSPLFLLGGAYLARYNFYGKSDLPKARAFLLTGAGLCVGSFVTSMIYRNIKNKHIRRAAALYNNEL